jgi:hypothetical protein
MRKHRKCGGFWNRLRRSFTASAWKKCCGEQVLSGCCQNFWRKEKAARRRVLLERVPASGCDCGLLGGGFSRLDRLGFPFKIAGPAFAFFGFVVLFAHISVFTSASNSDFLFTMKVCGRRFKVYLVLALATASLCGCATEKPKQPVAALRIHIQAGADTLGTTEQVTVVRADPVLVTIAKEPILTEANLIAARILNAPGGNAIEVRFDETGTWTLEQYTAANPGRHLVIFGQWGEKLAEGRWLAAPLITHRIGNGVLAFTPDMSRSEAEQLVLGLSNVAAFNLKQSK